MVRFIHAADLHLDSPFKGLSDVPEHLLKEIQESTLVSLKNIVNEAVSRQVDFVLIAGDIFDIEDRSIKAQVKFKREMERLHQHDISVYLIHGNHDSLADEKAYLEFPENVYVFGTEVETRRFQTNEDKTVSITGFSYKKRHIHKRMIQDFPEKKRDTDFHIGLLHGSQEGASSIHGEYAPFSAEEIRKCHYDYFALGHIHQRCRIHPSLPAYYSGNTQGRHRKETGAKGCLYVEEKAGELIPEFVETAPIRWETIELTIQDDLNLNAIYQIVSKELEELGSAKTLIHLTLNLSKEMPNNVLNKLSSEDLNAAFSVIQPDRLIWISKVKIGFLEAKNNIPPLESLFPEAWKEAVEEIKKEEAFEEIYDELQSQTPSHYLNDMHSDEYRNQIIEEAIKTLNHLIDL